MRKTSLTAECQRTHSPLKRVNVNPINAKKSPHCIRIGPSIFETPTRSMTPRVPFCFYSHSGCAENCEKCIPSSPPFGGDWHCCSRSKGQRTQIGSLRSSPKIAPLSWKIQAYLSFHPVLSGAKVGAKCSSALRYLVAASARHYST